LDDLARSSKYGVKDEAELIRPWASRELRSIYWMRTWRKKFLLDCSFDRASTVETKVNRNLKKDVCANHNYGTEENLTYAVRRYLRCIDS
jgi:hypothetical protein